MNITTNITPVKRGRKKKSETDKTETEKTETEKTDIISDEPKKRGRKKKIHISQITNDIDKITISEDKINNKKIKIIDSPISNSIYNKFINLSISDKLYFYHSYNDIMKIKNYEKNKIYLLQFRFAYISNDNDEYILPSSNLLEINNDNYLEYNKSKIYINNTELINNLNKDSNIMEELKIKTFYIFYNMYPESEYENDYELFKSILDNNLLDKNFILDNKHTMNLKFNINGKIITFRELLEEIFLNLN